MKIAFPAASLLPRDEAAITPCYGQVDNPQALADSLKTHLKTISTIGATTPFKIKVYDVEKAKPSFPLATAEQTGTAGPAGIPRELALCLSYYSTYNRPRTRGRVYIPAWLVTSNPGLRPTSSNQTEVVNSWGAALFRGLPPNVGGIVWSRFDKKAYGITNLWCDDEWDIIRSRGMRGTTRITATIP